MLRLSSHNAISVKRNLRMANFQPSASNFVMDNKTIRRLNLMTLKRRFKTWEELDAKTNVAASYLSQCGTGYRELGDNSARKIEAGLGEAKGWMDAVIDGMSNQAITPVIDDDKYYYIPCYSQAGGMGNGRSSQHEEITGKHSYSQSWLLAENLDPAQLCRIKGEGDSMLPTIAHKDSILVNKAENKVINGKVFAFRVGDEIRVKRLYRQMDGKVRVVSDNPDKAQYPDEFLSIDDMPEIIGRVRDRSGTNNL